MKPKLWSLILAAAALTSATHPRALAATVITNAADWAFASFLVAPNSTSRAWNFGNTTANAPIVMLNGVTITGNLGTDDPATGLDFTTSVLTYAINNFNWQTTTPVDQLPARNDLSKGGLHGGTGSFSMNLGGIPGNTYVIEIVSLQSGTTRSLDVSVDGVMVQDEWQVPGVTPFNRVLKLEAVCDADGIDLSFGRGSTAGTDMNPAIVALAMTQVSPAVALSILAQPRGFTNYAGEYSAAGMSVWAGGSGTFSYQWQKDEVDVPGATNRVLPFLNPLIGSDAGGYRVVVSGSSGGSITSSVANVLIMPVTATTTALAGYWPFDETTGATAADTSTFGNPGALINFPTDDSQWVAGQVGGSLNFRGAGTGLNDYVFVTNYPKPNATMTLSAWVWADARLSFATIAKNWPGVNGQFHFGVESTAGDLSNYLRQQGGAQIGPVREGAGTPLPTNSWQHVALVCDGKSMRLYRNGLQVGAPFAYDGTINTNPVNASLSIGAKWTSGTTADSFWTGKIDDLGLWTRALTGDEILSIYRAGTNSQPLTAATVANPPEILVQPQGFARYVGEYGRSLSAQAVGTPPVSYQWRKDGVEVPGATAATLSFPNPMGLGDSGTFTLIVSNAYHSVTSAPAVVTVTQVATISDALAGYWNFDEGAGALLVDYSGNANDGALVNFPTDDSQWRSGQIGGALHFRGPGTNDYVVVANYPKPDSTMTVTAWVWADSRPTWATIIKNWPAAANGQFHFGLNDVQGDLSNYLSQQGGSQVGPVREGSGSPLPVGLWQHVALVCNGQTMQLYRNGYTAGSPLAYNGGINTTALAPSLGIGAKLGPAGVPPTTADSGYWHGKLDDLGLWTRALNAEEILAIYVAGLNGAPLSEAVVGALPPTIATPPQSLTVTEGELATFSVTAAGTPPLSYQWRRNDEDVPSATNATLTIGNLCAGDGADYTVVIRNVAGTLTTPPATLTVLPLTETTAITTRLIAHWPFDETAGLIAPDTSTYANHGYLTNFPSDGSQWVAGQIGGALSFRGPIAGDYVLVPDYPKPSSNLTISAWVWADARPAWASIVKNWADQPGGELHLGLNNIEGDLSNYLIQQGGGFVGPVREGPENPLPLGSWQHVVLVCDGAKMQLYRNGIPVGNSLVYNGTINTNLTSSMLAIGAKVLVSGIPPAAADSGYWQGKMDDIGLWDRALSSAEIQGIYSHGLDGLGLDSASVRPRLTATRSAGQLVVSWPVSPAGSCYRLVSAESLPAPSWSVEPSPSLVADRYQVTVDITNSARFYQLLK